MSVSDETVYALTGDLAKDSSIFIKKTWMTIPDANPNLYSSNQCTITTESIANNPLYANYNEGYYNIPLLYTLTAASGSTNFVPATSATSADCALSLKSWYGQIVHSFGLDCAGNNVIQPVAYQSLWNYFKLVMSISYDSVNMHPSIGFALDSSQSVSLVGTGAFDGIPNTCANNMNGLVFPKVTAEFYQGEQCNKAVQTRQSYFNLNPSATTAGGTNGGSAFSSLISTTNLSNAYKSYVINTQSQTASVAGIWQCCIWGTINLSDLSDFFRAGRLPLSKGLNLTLKLALNNASCTFAQSATNVFSSCAVTVANNGVSPMMICSAQANNGSNACFTGAQTYIVSLSVGGTCLNSTQVGYSGIVTSPYKTVQLVVPIYQFAPQYEQSYTSGQNVVREFIWEDFTGNVIQNSLASGQSLVNQNLISGSIANAKSLLILPFYTPSANAGLDPLQTPFDSTPCTTSPFAYLSNLTVYQAGLAINATPINSIKEAWLNYVFGCRAINGGQRDDITSGLISELDFSTNYLYYHFDVSRMLDENKNVAKGYQITCNNNGAKALNLYVFLSYYRTFRVNVVTGATN